MVETIEERKARMARVRAARGQAKPAVADKRDLERQIAAARAKYELDQALANQDPLDFETAAETMVVDDGEFGRDAGVMFAGDAQYVVLYSTADGTTSKVRREQVISRVIPGPDGRQAFSEKPINKSWKYKMDPITHMPVKVVENARLCMLHPDHPDREMLDSIGLAGRTCDPEFGNHAASFRTEFDVRQHMDKKHHQEWLVIQSNEETMRREREDARQRELISAMRGSR